MTNWGTNNPNDLPHLPDENPGEIDDMLEKALMTSTEPEERLPTIEWLIESIAAGNSPLIEFNKKRLLDIISLKGREARIDELEHVIYEGDAYYIIWKNPKPHSREIKTISIEERIDQLKKETNNPDFDPEDIQLPESTGGD